MTRSLRFPVVLLLIFLGSLIFFLWGTQQMPVTDPVESNYTLTAKEMVLSGDWISPQIYGKYWYDKPALVYWLLSASYTVFGFSNFASRLPAAFCGALTIVLLVWYMRRIGESSPQPEENNQTALWAGILLATSLEFWIISHAIIADSMLLLFTIPTLLSAYIGIRQGSALHMIIAYGAAGLSCLAKGPVGLVLPGLILFLWCCTLRNGRAFLRLFHPLGLLAFVIVAAPWYVAMYNIHGNDFINGFIGLHNVTRALSSEHPSDNYIFYYLLVMPAALLPWTGLSLYGMWKGWKKRTDFSRLLLLWFWITMLFYTLVATKYITYTYIAVAPAIIFAAQALSSFTEESARGARMAMVIPFLLTMVALVIGTFFITGNFISFYVIAAYAAFLLLHQWRKKKYGDMPILSTASMAAALACIIAGGLGGYLGTRSSIEMAEYFHNLPGRHYFYDSYDASFTYYTGETAVRVHNKGITENRDARWEKKYIMPTIGNADLEKNLAESSDLSYLFVKKNTLDEFESDPLSRHFREHKVFSIGTIFESVKP